MGHRLRCGFQRILPPLGNPRLDHPHPLLHLHHPLSQQSLDEWALNPQPQQSNVWGRGGLVEEFFGASGAVGVGGHHDVDAFEWVGGFGA